jgi:hypothetical protein
MRLFQPDTVLAPQFFATLRRQGPRKRGEWQLVVAVLEDAVSCYQKYFLARNGCGQRLFREAYEWLMVNRDTPAADDDVPTFTFEYICEVLGLDPDYIRHGLQRWREEQLAKGMARIRAPHKPPPLPPVGPPVTYGLVLPPEVVSGRASA